MDREDPFRAPMLDNDTSHSTIPPVNHSSVEFLSSPSVIHNPKYQRVSSIGLPSTEVHPDRPLRTRKEISEEDVSYRGRATTNVGTHQQQHVSGKPFGISFDGNLSTLLPQNTLHTDDDDDDDNAFQHERNASPSRSYISSIHQPYAAVPDTEQLTPKTPAPVPFDRSGLGPQIPCRSKRNIYQGRSHWLSITILILAVYSTAFSAVWLVVAAIKPRFGQNINTTAGHLSPINASTFTAAFAKTIEISFVTVFVTFIGQVLSRRAYIRQSKGITIAEMSLKSWVTQPGTMITHWHSLYLEGGSVLGALSLAAVIVAVFYTTASATIGKSPSSVIVP